MRNTINNKQQQAQAQRRPAITCPVSERNICSASTMMIRFVLLLALLFALSEVSVLFRNIICLQCRLLLVRRFAHSTHLSTSRSFLRRPLRLFRPSHAALPLLSHCSPAALTPKRRRSSATEKTCANSKRRAVVAPVAEKS